MVGIMPMPPTNPAFGLDGLTQRTEVVTANLRAACARATQLLALSPRTASTQGSVPKPTDRYEVGGAPTLTSTNEVTGANLPRTGSTMPSPGESVPESVAGTHPTRSERLSMGLPFELREPEPESFQFIQSLPHELRTAPEGGQLPEELKEGDPLRDLNSRTALGVKDVETKVKDFRAPHTMYVSHMFNRPSRLYTAPQNDYTRYSDDD